MQLEASEGMRADNARSYHTPALLAEAIDGLNINPSGTYVDATFGGGGHSRAILDRLKEGRLIAFDQDEEAEREAEGIKRRSFTFCRANFMYLKKYLKLNQVKIVDGVLADLGISSHQIDEASRGFSTRLAGPLDMRMDRATTLTAAEVLNTYPEEKLHQLFGMYGELRNARTVARKVVSRRVERPFRTTDDLTSMLKPLAPRGKENKYLAQAFQALRIEVNEELTALEALLNQSVEVLTKGGRLVVITWHSLEDRIVKNFLNKGKFHGEADKDLYGREHKPFRAVNRKPLTPTEEEIKNNPRAKSAKLRVGERI